CAPYSTSVSSPHPVPKPESNAASESFRPKLEQDDGRTKLDKRDDPQNELKCHENVIIGGGGKDFPSVINIGETKWKRQTAVGLELLAEAGNYSALQRMFPSPYFYHPSLLGSMDSTTAAAAAAAMYSSMYRTPPAPHPQLQRPLVPRVLIHGLGPGGQPALNPLSNPLPGTPHPR
ncbi:barH-like 2 homeobox protein, partial [Protobothrops mucrosquamatus]|uniref:barH-like 2 homeobox protein n=1 Tax=Protobothrops mucrosquamatus TaxID=103944 RepID=UPI000775B677